MFYKKNVSAFMTMKSSTAYHARTKLPVSAGNGQARSPIPVSGVERWLMTLLLDLPKPSEYRFTADYSRAVAEYCLENWLNARSAKPPSVDQAVTQFRHTMMSGNDLSRCQVDQVCRRTFSTQRELPAWLYDTTERFLNVIKPWNLVWLSFTKWALSWCRQSAIADLAFLARDALPFFVAATTLEKGLHLHLAHISRTVTPDSLAIGSILRQPSVALIDSGCYGTCINHLRQQRDTLIGNSTDRGLATLLYYSRNPQLFGYVNYLMCRDMLASPETMDRAAEFVIYAGDLLEALPKPYQYCSQDRTMVEPSDLLSFTISIATLSDISSMAKADTFLDAERMDDAHEQVRLLYRSYQRSRHRSELRSDFLFDEPTPKSLPAPGALAGLDFLEIPPQSHIFGTASG
ncbi:MAG TPA: hypothetical protein VHY58_17150 [Streptosporangiaceae bacterium]|nr:hypothetical protein [Streptosporangiaceae bacterium]